MENELNFLNHAGTLVTSRLGDLCERVVRKNTDNQSKLPLTISSIDGLVDQRDYFNKIVAAKDMSGYYLLKRGEFAYNKSYSVGYDYGSIKRLNRYDEGCLSTLYICFAIKSDLIDSDYLEWFFNSLFWYKEMPNICAEGARNHGLLNVDTDEFFNLSITYPVDIEEQKKIAKILNSLDAKIASEKIETEKLKNLKSSMLTKMLPKEGKKVPEIRFDGFTDDWEQRKLLSCIRKITDFRGRTPKKLGMDWSESGYLALSALNVKDGYIDFSQDVHYGDQALYDKWMSGSELHKGQVLFTTEAPMGNVAQVPDNKKYILSQRTIAFDVNEDIIKENFLATLLRSPVVFKTLTSLSSGGTAKGVSQKSLASVDIQIPVELREQELLATHFTNLDNLITLHQRKYEKLLDVKKAMLSKLIGGAS